MENIPIYKHKDRKFYYIVSYSLNKIIRDRHDDENSEHKCRQKDLFEVGGKSKSLRHPRKQGLVSRHQDKPGNTMSNTLAAPCRTHWRCDQH